MRLLTKVFSKFSFLELNETNKQNPALPNPLVGALFWKIHEFYLGVARRKTFDIRRKKKMTHAIFVWTAFYT